MRTYQPGVVLYGVILGLLRAKGITFSDWCKERGLRESTARNALYGQSDGPVGRKLRNGIIDSAGREFVERAYAERVRDHANDIVGAINARRAS